MMSLIDTKLLIDAMAYYESIGYKPVASPMLVDKDVVELTLPKGNMAREHLGKYYVGSAEQSFYQIIKDGFNPVGSYMLITPCERDEIIDETHFGLFLKVELVSTVKSCAEICNDVDYFYSKKGFSSEVFPIGNSFDIEIGGIEVGSFGERIYKGNKIAFGTGLALPRITQSTKRITNE